MTEFDTQADSDMEHATACQQDAPEIPPAALAEIAAIVQEYEAAVWVEVQAIIHKHGKYGLN